MAKTVTTKGQLIAALEGLPDATPLAAHGSWSDHFSPSVTVRESRHGTVIVTLHAAGGGDTHHYDVDYYPEKS